MSGLSWPPQKVERAAGAGGSCHAFSWGQTHAALQVTAEGGIDAAQEAPYIYAALDALAARAAAWAEHRQRNLISAAPQGAAASMLLPEAVGRQAAEVVRQVGTGLLNPQNLAQRL